jgi:hypothetical protein
MVLPLLSILLVLCTPTLGVVITERDDDDDDSYFETQLAIILVILVLVPFGERLMILIYCLDAQFIHFQLC